MIPQVLKNVDVHIVSARGPKKFIDFVENYGLDTWDWVAIGIALLSLFVAYWAARLQYKTEKNTMKITEEGQFDLLVDYFRHFYANLVIALSIHKKLMGHYATEYPSQEHFRKLTVDIEALHPEIFFHSKDKYNEVHNLLLLLRNLNYECGVAEEHVCNKDIIDDAKERDLNTLIFKQNYFINRFYQTIKNLCDVQDEELQKFKDYAIDRFRKDSQSRLCKRLKTFIHWVRFLFRPKKKRVYNLVKYMTLAHDAVYSRMIYRNKNALLERLKIDEKCLKSLSAAELNRKLEHFFAKKEEIKEYWKIEPEDNNFLKYLFPDPEEGKLFTNLLRFNVYVEITGKNSQEYDKIFIIPFNKPTK